MMLCCERVIIFCHPHTATRQTLIQACRRKIPLFAQAMAATADVDARDAAFHHHDIAAADAVTLLIYKDTYLQAKILRASPMPALLILLSPFCIRRFFFFFFFFFLLLPRYEKIETYAMPEHAHHAPRRPPRFTPVRLPPAAGPPDFAHALRHAIDAMLTITRR